jgi:diguanylate cyclase (GGDEF)-like protein
VSHPLPAAQTPQPDSAGTSRAPLRSAGSLSLPSWVWLLSRPLAVDEHRVQFWVRHVRIGIVLTEVSALIVVVYALVDSRPHPVALLVMAGLVMALAPGLLLLPMDRWCRDHRGALVFYVWSSATTAVVACIALLDGGGSSPLIWLLVLTLTYAGLAYPPVGVALMGSLMVATYLGISLAAPNPVGNVFVPAAVLAVFTVMIGWASRNQWDMADQQQLIASRLATLAGTDELTFCLNRRAFDLRLRAVLTRADEHRPVSLCVLDLDGFKQVNDSGGHAAGDRVLIAVAQALRIACRETDSVSRLGGDEFAVLLPGTTAAEAAAAGLRLLETIDAAVARDRVTVSIGVATTSTPITADALLAAADQLMYEAKARGGNQTRAAGVLH